MSWIKAPRFSIGKSLPGGFRIGTSFGVDRKKARAERHRAVIDPIDAFLQLIGEQGGTVAVQRDAAIGWQVDVSVGYQDSADFYGVGSSMAEAVIDVQKEMGWIR